MDIIEIKGPMTDQKSVQYFQKEYDVKFRGYLLILKLIIDNIISEYKAPNNIQVRDKS